MTMEATVESPLPEKRQPAFLTVVLSLAGAVSIIFTMCYAYHIGL